MYTNDVLRKLFTQKNKEIYAKVTSLTLDELPIEAIEGRVTGGNISYDGKSGVRRTCNITMATGLDTQIEDKINWALNSKIKLELGVLDRVGVEIISSETGRTSENQIFWFKMGTYVISGFSASKNTTGYTLNIQGKDKMCLINGDVGGKIYGAVDFGTFYITNKLTGDIDRQDYVIEEIIREGMREYGGEPYHNIIIEDIPKYGSFLLDWQGKNPLFIFMDPGTSEAYNCYLDQLVWYENNGSYVKKRLRDITTEGLTPDPVVFMSLNSFIKAKEEGEYDGYTEFYLSNPATTEDPKAYYVIRILQGYTAGFSVTDLTYPRGKDEDSALTVGPGGTFTEILDKIVGFLGNYEYFYNVDGQFIFRKKQKDMAKSGWSVQFNDVGLGNPYEIEAADTPAWDFSGEELISSFSDSPNINNVRNDFSIWGSRQSGDTELPIHLRYAIHAKPFYYKSIAVSKEEIYQYVAAHPEFKNSFDKSDPNWEFPGNNDNMYVDKPSVIYYYGEKYPYTAPAGGYDVDWREIIYQMAKDYLKFKHFDNFEARVMKANYIEDPGIQLYVNGITNYEQYYVDLEANWRSLYNPRDLYIDEDKVGYTTVDKDTFTAGEDTWTKDVWYKFRLENGTPVGYERIDNDGYFVPLADNNFALKEQLVIGDPNSSTSPSEPFLLESPHRLCLSAYLGLKPNLWYSSEPWIKKNRINITFGDTHFQEPTYQLRKTLDLHPKVNATQQAISSSKPSQGTGIYYDNSTSADTIEILDLSLSSIVDGFYVDDVIMMNQIKEAEELNKFYAFRSNKYNMILPIDDTKTWTEFWGTDEEHHGNAFVQNNTTAINEEYNYYTIYKFDVPRYETYSSNHEGGYEVGDRVIKGDYCYECVQDNGQDSEHPFVDPSTDEEHEYWVVLSLTTTEIQYYILDSVDIKDEETEEVTSWDMYPKRIKTPSLGGLKYYDGGAYVYRLGFIRNGLNNNRQILTWGNTPNTTSILITRVGALDDALTSVSTLVRMQYGINNNYLTTYKTSNSDFGDQTLNSDSLDYYDEEWVNVTGCHVYDLVKNRLYFSNNIWANFMFYSETESKKYISYRESSGTGWHWNPLMVKTPDDPYDWEDLWDTYYYVKFNPLSGDLEIDDHEENYKHNLQTIDYYQKAEFYQSQKDKDKYSSNSKYRYWNKKLEENPESLTFWFDFLDSPTSAMGKYGVDNIQYRPKVETDQKASAIYYRDTVNAYYEFQYTPNSTDDLKQKLLIPYVKEAENPIFKADQTVQGALSSSSKGHSCKDTLDDWMFKYTYANETVNITSMPLYHLQPNDLIALDGGVYTVDSISIPLTYNGTMNIKATKKVSSLYGGGEH